MSRINKIHGINRVTDFTTVHLRSPEKAWLMACACISNWMSRYTCLLLDPCYKIAFFTFHTTAFPDNSRINCSTSSWFLIIPHFCSWDSQMDRHLPKLKWKEHYSDVFIAISSWSVCFILSNSMIYSQIYNYSLTISYPTQSTLGKTNKNYTTLVCRGRKSFLG